MKFCAVSDLGLKLTSFNPGIDYPLVQNNDISHIKAHFFVIHFINVVCVLFFTE